MKKDELQKRVEDFNKFITGTSNRQEVFEGYSKFYRWLLKRAKEVDSDTNLFLGVLYDLTYSAIKWVQAEGIYFKQLSTNWDWRLVKTTGKLTEEYKQFLKNGENVFKDERFMTKYKIILSKLLLEEQDFATYGYCCQMLQNSGVINFKHLSENIKNPSKDEDSIDQPFESSTAANQMKWKYVENDDLVTMAEAKEKGYKMYLLMYPDGHDSQNTFIQRQILVDNGYEDASNSKLTVSLADVNEMELTEDERKNLREMDRVAKEMLAPTVIV